MTRPSRVMTVTAALALALLPAGFAASSAFADSAAAPVAPAFTVTQTAAGFDVTILGTGATVSFTVTPTGAVQAADSDADEAEVDLPDSAAADSNQQEGDNNDQQGPDEQQGDNKDDQSDSNDQQGPDDQSGDQQGPNDQSGDQGSND